MEVRKSYSAQPHKAQIQTQRNDTCKKVKKTWQTPKTLADRPQGWRRENSLHYGLQNNKEL